jgi:hypothetical protein
MASTPTRGMYNVEERRASVDVARQTSRVGCAFAGVEAGLRVDKWTRVGRWAWTVEVEGLGWVIRIMLMGLASSLAVLIWSVDLCSWFNLADVGTVAGACCAASASRWRVTLLMPMRMCLPISGGGGGASSDVGASRSFWLFLFLFLPLEGSTCVLR